MHTEPLSYMQTTSLYIKSLAATKMEDFHGQGVKRERRSASGRN